MLGPSPNGSLSSSEFLLGESICAGDSGGPVFAGTGAVVGVAARGGNGISESNPAASCTGDAALNTYSLPSAFKSVILEAFAATGETPWLEDQAKPAAAALDANTGKDARRAAGACAASLGQPNGALLGVLLLARLAMGRRRRRS
jgi:secreted trypsin-like serine protease